MYVSIYIKSLNPIKTYFSQNQCQSVGRNRNTWKKSTHFSHWEKKKQKKTGDIPSSYLLCHYLMYLNLYYCEYISHESVASGYKHLVLTLSHISCTFDKVGFNIKMTHAKSQVKPQLKTQYQSSGCFCPICCCSQCRFSLFCIVSKTQLQITLA